ncbi:class II aldolase/adducin family protein [Dyella psychrodurans]|uniref:Class II aldolase/adducin family protein n=1 Tax=Dyella psychrodurans TaxID=1927960 RepID=A0A370X6F7_9GAMM|nr:class II aldolase/adducin family protein [Dyella psychrodurans]RDS84004.1 class II aldolase/adducin family protein [Dyella psychrodurans]
MKFESIRRRVVEMSVLLADHGYFAATGGNLALRADDEHIVVTPSAVDYYQMGPEDICVLRLRNLSKVDGERKPSVESGMHAQLLRKRTDCCASIHTHQPAASALTLLGQPLPVQRANHQALLGPQVLIAGYAPSGTRWLSSKLTRVLRPDVNAYLLRTHGAICCGASPERALQAIAALEALATAYLRERIAARAALATPEQGALRKLIATLDAHPVQELIA